jgi:group I intron endonuclease
VELTLIVNKINGKCCIGSSVDINKRWAQHKCTLRTNNHKNKHLQNAWNKYGENNFFFKIIFFCEQNDLFLHEQKFLDINVGGYNIGEDAICPARGLKKTEAHKKKLSESQIGNKRPQEIIDKIRKTATGKKQSPELA